jgi:hypothetical protein
VELYRNLDGFRLDVAESLYSRADKLVSDASNGVITTCL